MVQTHAAKVENAVEFPVTFQTAAYPVTVRWNVTKGTAAYQLTDGNGGKTFHPKQMVGAGSMTINGGSQIAIQLIGDGQLPKAFALNQNYPNPFNPTTNIKFSIPKSGYVEIKIYDVLGKEMGTLVSDPYLAGTYIAGFNASKLASGVYFYRIVCNDYTQTMKMMILK